MTKTSSSDTTMGNPPPQKAQDRAAYVAELRSRYLAGTLDEVLIPDESEVPDRLLSALFPNLFPEKTEFLPS